MVTFGTQPMRFPPSSMSVSLDRMADFLSTVPLFRERDRQALRGFAEVTREQRVAKGALVVTEGDAGDALYVVRSGEVKVALPGDEGREVILGILGVGDHFGELSLVDGRPRSAHVVATQPSTLIVLRRAEFRRQVEQNPQVAWWSSRVDCVRPTVRLAASCCWTSRGEWRACCSSTPGPASRPP